MSSLRFFNSSPLDAHRTELVPHSFTGVNARPRHPLEEEMLQMEPEEDNELKTMSLGTSQKVPYKLHVDRWELTTSFL